MECHAGARLHASVDVGHQPVDATLYGEKRNDGPVEDLSRKGGPIIEAASLLRIKPLISRLMANRTSMRLTAFSRFLDDGRLCT